ncbi:MAG: hypothetical protein EBV86_12260 [Marivivens sp.]|nr:hypothetical protein [Marivivens sp.]
MTTYYIFTIFYMLNGYEMESHILVNSADKCYELVLAAEEISNVLPADILCKDTGTVSGSLKPRLRPD